MVKCLGQFCFNICFLWFIYGWRFRLGSFSTTGGGSASRAHLYKHYVHLLFTTCSATATHKNISNHYKILSYNNNGMTSYTVTPGSSDFHSKALLTCTICSKYKSQGNAHNPKRYFSSTSYTIIYYTQKQAISDTNISKCNYTILHTWILCIKYSDLALWTFLCHLTAEMKHTQLYLILIQLASIVHNTTMKT